MANARARGVSGLAVQPRIVHDRVVDVARDQQAAARRPLRQPCRGVRGQVSRGRRSRTARRLRCASRRTGFLYRGKGYCCLPFGSIGTQNAPFIQQMQASVSYVTGAHAIKVGFQNDFGTTTSAQFDNEYGLVLHVQQRRADFDRAARAAVHADDAPVAATSASTRRTSGRSNARPSTPAFASTTSRTTSPSSTSGRPRSCRTGTSRFPQSTYANMKDITPRVGVAYDLFGNGKTVAQGAAGAST